VTAVAAPSALDVVTAAILRAKLESVVGEMSTVLVNTAHSARISTSHAFACAVLTESGEVVALDNPLHLAPIAETAAACLDYYRFATAADDVILTNDPYSGGSSLHYFTLVAPLAHGDDIVAYLAVQAHMIDIGGVVMGNYHPGATELWAEGVRVSPLKVVVDGKTRRDAMDTLVLNSRDPEGFRGDLDAVLATLNIGRRRLLELIDDYGFGQVADSMAASAAYAERRLRAELQRIPTGVHEGEAVLDHDGQGRSDLAVRVRLERVEGGVRLDFTATDDQSTGFVNSPPANTRAYALLPLLGLLDDSVPWNSGLFRAVEVVTRPGSLVHPTFPTPTGWCREHVGFEIAEAVAQALAAALPELAGLGYANRSLVFSVEKQVRVGGVEEQLAVTDYAVLGQAGSPGRSSGDGWGQPGPASVGLLPSLEEFEAEAEATVVRLEYVTDSAGAGRWRGAPGTETVLRFPPGSNERLFACVAGSRHPSPGYAGGAPAGPAAATLRRDGVEERVELLQDEPVADGAELVFVAGGGGGWGDPRRRDASLVRSDVLNGYVSAQAARDVYGVALDGDALELDTAETERLRAATVPAGAVERG
jgi:N-methylhydantoinase B